MFAFVISCNLCSKSMYSMNMSVLGGWSPCVGRMNCYWYKMCGEDVSFFSFWQSLHGKSSWLTTRLRVEILNIGEGLLFPTAGQDGKVLICWPHWWWWCMYKGGGRGAANYFYTKKYAQMYIFGPHDELSRGVGKHLYSGAWNIKGLCGLALRGLRFYKFGFEDSQTFKLFKLSDV